MRVLLVPVGSHGDMHPFLGLGQVLRARGHQVIFVTNGYFEPLVRSLGFEAALVGEDHDFEVALQDPDLWHPTRGMRAVFRRVISLARPSYDKLAGLNVPGETVLVGGSLAWGARLAREVLGIPLATVHLSPSVFATNYEPPVYSGKRVPPWFPFWFKRAFFNFVFKHVVDPNIEPGLNEVRAGLGLAPVRDVMRGWIHAPECVLALFPAWFGPPQPDWPGQVTLCGFPMYDERDATPMPPDLETFLAAGPSPLAFTPGSANVHARPFFEAAADACRRLGRRGLLLTRFPEQVPADLPEGVVHVPYAPFGLLLPRVAALAHHGGIGTASQAMAAGVPQLVMPLAHDQFDNAARMERLGVARSLLPAKFTGRAVAARLRELTSSPLVALRCREVAGRFRDGSRPLEAAADAVEALARPAAVVA